MGLFKRKEVDTILLGRVTKNISNAKAVLVIAISRFARLFRKVAARKDLNEAERENARKNAERCAVIVGYLKNGNSSFDLRRYILTKELDEINVIRMEPKDKKEFYFLMKEYYENFSYLIDLYDAASRITGIRADKLNLKMLMDIIKNY